MLIIHYSTVINDTTKILSEVSKAVLSPQQSNPPISLPDKDGNEETTMRCIDYVATLTESKIVEV